MRGRSLLPFIAVAAAGVFGAWLLGMFETSESAAADASGRSVLVAFAGFVLLLGSMVAGLLLLRRALPPISRAEMVSWGDARQRGRSRFVRSGVVRGLFVGLYSLAAVVLLNYLRGEPAYREFGWTEIAFYPLLLLVIVIGAWYNAVRVWDVNEQAYKQLLGDAPAERRAEPTPE